jgi:hypothetical protein
MGPRRWNRQQAPALDLGKLPVALMDQPVVAVAEQHQVGESLGVTKQAVLQRLGKEWALATKVKVPKAAWKQTVKQRLSR